MHSDRAMLVKIGERKWMEALVKDGAIRLRPLRYYARYDGNLVIGDPLEGTLARYPKENPTLRIEAIIGGERLHLPKSSLTLNSRERNHGVYCMMAVPPVAVQGGLDVNRTLEPGLSNKRIFEFGDTAVFFLHSDKFAERLSNALAKAGHSAEGAGVRYVPFGHTGDMGSFCKLDSYEYQREYRFLTHDPINETLDLELGPLNDIALLLDLSQLRRQAFNAA